MSENKTDVNQKSSVRLFNMNSIKLADRSTLKYFKSDRDSNIERASSSKYGTFDLGPYTLDVKELSNSIPSIDKANNKTFTKAVIENSNNYTFNEEKHKIIQNKPFEITVNGSPMDSSSRHRTFSLRIADKFLNKNLKSLSKNQKKKPKGLKIDRPTSPHDFYTVTKKASSDTPVDGRLITTKSKNSSHKRIKKDSSIDLEDEGQYRLGKHVDSFKRLEYKFNNGSIMTLTASDYSCLYDNQWINDTVIDFFLKYIVQNNKIGLRNDSIYVLTTYFFSKLVSKVPKHTNGKKQKNVEETDVTAFNDDDQIKLKPKTTNSDDCQDNQNDSLSEESNSGSKVNISIHSDTLDCETKKATDSNVSQVTISSFTLDEEVYSYYGKMKRWLAKSRLHEYDYIIMPINESLHWYCAVICNFATLLTAVKERKHMTVTSIDDEISEEKFIFCYIYYFDSLSQKHENIKNPIINCLMGYAKDILNIELTKEMFQLRRAIVPKQNNFNDCGIHVIYNIKKFIQQPTECLSFWMKYNSPNRKISKTLSTVFDKEERDKYRKYLRLALQKLESEYSKKHDDNIKSIDYSDDEIEILDIPSTNG